MKIAALIALVFMVGCGKPADLATRIAYWQSILDTAPMGASTEDVLSWAAAHKLELHANDRQTFFAFVEAMPDSFPCSKQEIEVEIFFDQSGRSTKSKVVNKPTCL